MTQQSLTEHNLGHSLDALANLDPRGYGVCRILYDAAREAMGGPLCIHAAKALVGAVKPGDCVYILTGFVLSPWNKAETDGVIGSVFLARALEKAFGARPVIVCSEEAVQAARALTELCGLQGVKVISFTKDKAEAESQTESLLAEAPPRGMGKIAPQLERYVPCIPAATAAEYLITATVSDWGCYALIAALAFLREDIGVMHGAELELAACELAVQHGLIDMTGLPVPAIDGFGPAINTLIVTLMRECVRETLRLRETCAPWFGRVIERGYFEGKA